MSARSKIPDSLHDEILILASEKRWSSRRIARWLGEEKGVSVGFAAVARLIRAHKNERADVARAVVREKLAPSLCRDVDRLEKLIRKMLKRIKPMTDDAIVCRLSAEARNLIDTKLKYSGAGEPDSAEAVEDLAAFFAKGFSGSR